MKDLLSTATVLASLMLGTSAYAEGLFGGGNKLDPAFCKEINIRQTVIYVDDQMLVKGQNDWVRDVYDKLRATLVPGERTTLVELSPSTGQSTERWSGCWPAYSASEAAKLANQLHIFSTSPLSNVKEQQGFFARDLGIAIESIERNRARLADQVAIDPNNPPKESIIRALASDGARYAHTQETIRAILYSNLAENSDLGSVYKPLPNPAIDYGVKLGTFLRRSVFYVFGAGLNIKGDGSLQDEIRSFWQQAFQSMAANVGGIGTDLSVPNVLPTAAHSFDILLKDEGNTLTGRLALLTGSDGTLVDSWLGIVRLRTAALNGTYTCNGEDDRWFCTLQATTAGGVVTMSPSETVHLSSSGTSVLTGTIGVPGSSVNLPLAATAAEN